MTLQDLYADSPELAREIYEEHGAVVVQSGLSEGVIDGAVEFMISHFRDQLLGKSCNQTCTVQIPKENDIMLAVFKSMGFTKSAAFAPGGVVMVYRVKGGRNRLLQYLNKDWMDSDLKRRIG